MCSSPKSQAPSPGETNPERPGGAALKLPKQKPRTLGLCFAAQPRAHLSPPGHVSLAGILVKRRTVWYFQHTDNSPGTFPKGSLSLGAASGVYPSAPSVRGAQEGGVELGDVAWGSWGQELPPCPELSPGLGAGPLPISIPNVAPRPLKPSQAPAGASPTTLSEPESNPNSRQQSPRPPPAPPAGLPQTGGSRQPSRTSRAPSTSLAGSPLIGAGRGAHKEQAPRLGWMDAPQSPRCGTQEMPGSPSCRGGTGGKGRPGCDGAAPAGTWL